MRYLSCIILSIISVTLISCERPNEPEIDDDGIPPAVPSGLNFYYATDGEILIEWNSNAERDISGYNIYKKINDADFALLSFTRDIYYLDDSLNYEDLYSYKISALDKSGRESETSDVISAKPANKYIPHKPAYAEINARNWEGKKSVYLSWEPGYESDVVGYNIYRSFSETFNADSSSLIGFTSLPFYDDSSAQLLYTNYYYKIRAVDKGGLLSNESSTLSDRINDIPGIIVPLNNAVTEYFQNFKIKTLKVPATYKIVLQENEYFGEIWSTDVYSELIEDTLSIPFTAGGLYSNVKYFWRIITYSSGNGPNSISPLYNFTLKQE